MAGSLAVRDRLPSGDAERRWLAYNVEAISGIGGDPVAMLPYERWFTDPHANLRAIAGLLGEPELSDLMQQSVLDRVVDKTLCHHDTATAQAGSLAAWLYRRLLAAAPAGTFGPELRTAAAALDGFAEVMLPVETERSELNSAVTTLTTELVEAQERVAALEQAEQAREQAEAKYAEQRVTVAILTAELAGTRERLAALEEAETERAELRAAVSALTRELAEARERGAVLDEATCANEQAEAGGPQETLAEARARIAALLAAPPPPLGTEYPIAEPAGYPDPVPATP